jgi:hypothetical protein
MNKKRGKASKAAFSLKDAERRVSPIGISLEVVFRRLDVVFRKTSFFVKIGVQIAFGGPAAWPQVSAVMRVFSAISRVFACGELFLGPRSRSVVFGFSRRAAISFTRELRGLAGNHYR